MLDVAEQHDNEESDDSQGKGSSSVEPKEEDLVIVDDDTIEDADESDEHDDETEYDDEDDDDDDEDDDSIEAALRHKEKEVEALKTRLLRSHADMENFKRRFERDKQDSIKFANKNIFLQLLDVLDNFDRAFSAAPDPKDNFVIGVNMIYKQLGEVLTQNGVEEINAMGRLFDPYLDEALAKEVSTEHPESTVLEVFQRGFRFHGSLLRPAKVKVAVAPEPEIIDSEEAPDEEASEESTTE
jgi:molecular chaperone GrpE